MLHSTNAMDHSCYACYHYALLMLSTATVWAAHAKHCYGVCHSYYALLWCDCYGLHRSHYVPLWCALLILCTTMVCTAHTMHRYGVHCSHYAPVWCALLTLCIAMVCTAHTMHHYGVTTHTMYRYSVHCSCYALLWCVLLMWSCYALLMVTLHTAHSHAKHY